MNRRRTFAAPNDYSSSSSEDFVDTPEPELDTDSDESFYSSILDNRQTNPALVSFFRNLLAFNNRMADTTMTDGTVSAAKEARMGVPTPFSGSAETLRNF